MATNPSHDGTPRLDEAMFQKLLAAAYVIQEHRNQTDLQLREQSDNPGAVDAEYATTLAEIVETQHQILLRHLDLDAAAALVVEQLKKITSASGAAVCLLDHDHLVYRAVSGMAAAEMGQALPRGHSLSAVVVSDGVVLRCADVLTESQVDPLVAQRARVGSFIAVPIFHDDEVAGALELVFAKAHGYQEHDIRTCQLMAGLVTEGLTRSVDAEWKRNLAAERDSMLEALEKLKPQLDRLAKDAQALSASAGPARPRAAAPPGPAMDESVLKPDVVKAKVTKPSVLASKARSVAGTATEACHRCGHQVAVEDVYCGICGSLRWERSRA